MDKKPAPRFHLSALRRHLTHFQSHPKAARCLNHHFIDISKSCGILLAEVVMNPKHHQAPLIWRGRAALRLPGELLKGALKTPRAPGLLLRGLVAAVAPRGKEGWISLLGRGLGGDFNRNAGKLRAMLRLGFIFILPRQDPGRRADAPRLNGNAVFPLLLSAQSP